MKKMIGRASGIGLTAGRVSFIKSSFRRECKRRKPSGQIKSAQVPFPVLCFAPRVGEGCNIGTKPPKGKGILLRLRRSRNQVLRLSLNSDEIEMRSQEGGLLRLSLISILGEGGERGLTERGNGALFIQVPLNNGTG
jgi:hypothetical protein